MIEVTRLNGTIFFINPDMIITLESTPDTVISLTTGEKLVVKDPVNQIIDQFVAYKRRITAGEVEVKPYTPPEEPSSKPDSSDSGSAPGLIGPQS